MIRAFLALQISDDVRRRVQALTEELKKCGLDGRPARLESIHLTMKFLGYLEEGRLSSVVEAAAEVAGDLESFEVVAGGVGVFPHLARPRVVWMGIESCQPLLDLHGLLERRLTELDFDSEDRTFKPHLTLMRLRSKKNLKRLEDWIEEKREMTRLPFRVSELCLFQSILKSSGAEYRKLAGLPFRENL